MPLPSNVSIASRLSHNTEFRLLFFSMTPLERQVCRHISETVLPSFRQACAERGAHLVLVDPQSGVINGKSFSSKHVARTLKELNAGTFFIGLIGSPNAGAIDAAGCPELQSLAETNPGLAEALRRGLSPGDIVIREGVVRRPERMKHRAAFFLHDPAQFTREPNDRQFLSALKHDAQRSGFPFGEFHTTEKLVDGVDECLRRWLDLWFPADELGTHVEHERQEHEDFRATYSPSYIQRPRTFGVLDAFVDAESRGPLWVIGPSGIGKTSLLVNWIRRFRDESPNVFVIEHYVGATPSSRNLIGFMRRVLWQLKRRFNIAADVPVRADNVVDAYNLWLSEEKHEPVVLVIDGVDQFERLGEIISPLPAVIPPHLRIIASARLRPESGGPGDSNPAQTLVVPGLMVGERQKLLARDFSARHPLPLPMKLLRKVARIRAARQTFHSQLVARVLTDPGFTEREVANMLERYEQTADPDELLDLMLEDLAARTASLPVRAFLTALWASENGLTMDELSIICGSKSNRDMEGASVLAAAFDPCLVHRNGLYTLSHTHISLAVERRYLNAEDARRSAHLALADLFADQRSGSRQALELPWQLRKGGATPRLYTELSRIETLKAFLAEGREHELLMYWSERSRTEIERRYRAGLKQYGDQVKRNSTELARARVSVAEFLQLAGCFDAAADILRKELPAMRKRSPESHEYVACLNLLADAELALGRTTRSLALLRMALDIQKSLNLDWTIEHAETHRRLAYVLDAAGRHGDALESLNIADEILCRKLGKLDERCLRIAADRGAALYRLEQYDAAEDLLLATLHNCEDRQHNVGENHTLTLEVLNSLGAVYERQALLAASSANGGSESVARWLAQARLCRERALAISERLYPPGHPDITARMINLGMQCRMEGDYHGAETLYRKVLAYDEHTFPPIHPRIAGTLINLASVLRLQGNDDQLEEALDNLRRALKIRRSLRDSTNLEISDVELNLASLLKQMERLDEALGYYRRALPARVVHWGLNHRLTQAALGGLADLMARLGRSYAKGRGPTSSLAEKRVNNRTNRARRGTDAGLPAQALMYAMQGDLAKARRLCRKIIAQHRRNSDTESPELLEALDLLAACM